MYIKEQFRQSLYLDFLGMQANTQGKFILQIFIYIPKSESYHIFVVIFTHLKFKGLILKRYKYSRTQLPVIKEKQ